MHAREPSLLYRHASPLSVLLLGGLLLAAAAGGFGGTGGAQMALDTNDVSLQVTTPPVLRNGEFFETRIRVTAGRWLGNAVVAVSPGLWRDVTVDTLREQRARRDSLTRAEVESEMRLAGIARMSEVGWAVLEPQGKISFIRASAGSEPAEQRDEDGAR